MGKTEQRLAGFRVLLTRPRERAGELCFMLEDEGAEVLSVPLLELAPPSDERPLRAAAETLTRYSWVVFSSASGVTGLVEATRRAGTEAILRRARCAAIGSSTARVARNFGLNVVVEAAVNTSSGLFESLKGHLRAGDELLLPTAEEGRTELEQQLREHGFGATRVAAYQTTQVAPDPLQWEGIISSIPDSVVFASPKTAEAFSALPDSAKVLKNAAVVAIGPTTAEALKAFSVTASIAARPTAEAIVEAVVLALRERTKQKRGVQ